MGNDINEILRWIHTEINNKEYVKVINMVDDYISYIKTDGAEDFEHLLSQLYSYRGDANYKLENFREAGTDYKEALKYNPNNPNLYKKCADAIYDSGSSYESMSYYYKYREMNFDNNECKSKLYLKAKRLERHKNYDEALSIYTSLYQDTESFSMGLIYEIAIYSIKKKQCEQFNNLEKKSNCGLNLNKKVVLNELRRPQLNKPVKNDAKCKNIPRIQQKATLEQWQKNKPKNIIFQENYQKTIYYKDAYKAIPGIIGIE